MNAIWCLENPPACYFTLAKATAGGGCFWDFAATACTFPEYGAWVSENQGAALRLNQADSIHLNHSGILYATHEAVARRFLAVSAALREMPLR